MATCDLGYSHEDDPPAPVIIEQPPPVTSDNDVRIAEVEAEARVESDRIYAGARDVELVAEVERLRGKLAGMETVLATLAPADPAPAPAPAPAPIPVPVPEPVTAPPEITPKQEGKKKSSMWDGYN